MIQFDEHIFQMGGSTTNQFCLFYWIYRYFPTFQHLLLFGRPQVARELLSKLPAEKFDGREGMTGGGWVVFL